MLLWAYSAKYTYYMPKSLSKGSLDIDWGHVLSSKLEEDTDDIK